MQRIVAIPDKRGAPLQLLAFCAALTVNAVQTKTDSANNPRLAQANTVASALHIDMNQWVTPTAANFFERISKSQIHRALSEAGKTPDSSTTTFKKAQLAETQIAGSSWLPQPLRIASYYQTCFKRSVSVPPRTKPPARAAPLGAVQQI